MRERATLRVAAAYAFVSVLALLAVWRLETPAKFFGAPGASGVLTGKDLGGGALLGLGAGAALALLGEIFTRRTVWGRSIHRAVRRILGKLHPGDALLLAALSALGEETLFRGVLLPYAGLATSSALFGFAHLIPRRGFWMWSVWAAGAGLLFGWLAMRTGGLAAPVLAHFTVNAVGLLTLGRRGR